MKKGLLMIVMVAAIGATGFSQNFYISPEIGYSFGTARQNVDNYFFDGFSESGDQLVYSLGQGFNFGGGIGYMFNSNIGIELGVNYLIGSIASTRTFGTQARSSLAFFSCGERMPIHLETV
jgi:opacity protein-like surface antigen